MSVLSVEIYLAPRDFPRENLIVKEP